MLGEEDPNSRILQQHRAVLTQLAIVARIERASQLGIAVVQKTSHAGVFLALLTNNAAGCKPSAHFAKKVTVRCRVIARTRFCLAIRALRAIHAIAKAIVIALRARAVVALRAIGALSGAFFAAIAAPAVRIIRVQAR